MKIWGKRISGVRSDASKGSKMERTLTSSRKRREASMTKVLQAEEDREGNSAGEVGESTQCFVDTMKTFRFYVNCKRKQG